MAGRYVDICAALSHVRFCSECGHAIVHKWLVQEGRHRCVCGSCGVVHYENPRVIVGCIVCWLDKVLLCRRAENPARGQWIVPSGYLEHGETLEQGAARETFEEAGLILDPDQLDLYSVMNMTATGQGGCSVSQQLGEPARYSTRPRMPRGRLHVGVGDPGRRSCVARNDG
jgi:8-oxo-dGTP pyrophosphatase MutT (NUDIX family)